MPSNMSGANGDHDDVYNTNTRAGADVSGGLSQSGIRAGSSADDPWMQYWTGAATPAQMAAAQAQGTTASGPAANVSSAQDSLLQQLQNQAQGKGPSLAQMQLQQGTQANIKGAAALAATGRTPGMSGYQAAQGATAANQQLAGQSAQQRLAEQYQAQAGLAGLTGQMANQQQQLGEFNAAQGQQNNQFNANQSQNQNQFFNQMMGSQQAQTNQYLQNKDISRTNNNAQMVGSLVSDKRKKKNIKPGGGSLDRFMSKMGKKAVY